YGAIERLARRTDLVSGTADLSKPDAHAAIVADVQERIRPAQLEIEGVARPLDVPAIVSATIDLIQRSTIDIPRVLVVPRDEVRAGYNAFPLRLERLRLQPPSEDLWMQYLRTGVSEVLVLSAAAASEQRLEDF